MVTFLGFLFIAISIAFIIGLVNPSLILRWSKKPTRGKVFLLYILFTSAIIFFIAVTAPVEQQSSSASENDEDVKSLEERKDTTIILGELKIDENVISHGKETEVSVMKRMLNETDFDKINIELIEVSNAYGKQKVIYEYDAKKKTLRCYNLKMMSVCEQQNIDKETLKVP